MIWALMLHDYACWHNDPEFVKARAIGLRSMLEHFRALSEPATACWKICRAGRSWIGCRSGEAATRPDGARGVSSLNNLLYVYALEKSAEVEDSLGEPLLAQRLRAKAARTAAAVRAKFWDESRGLMADNLAHTEFSEHGQCLALLTDTLTGDQAKRCFEQLLTAPDLKRTTIYFSFYLLETWQKFGRGDLIVRADEFLEGPGQTRAQDAGGNAGQHALRLPRLGQSSAVPSCTPAWPASAPPRPGSAPSALRRCRASCRRSSAARRTRTASLRWTWPLTDGHCRGSVELPPAITGVFVWGAQEQKLASGANAIDLGP